MEPDIDNYVSLFATSLQAAGTQHRAEHEKAYLKSELDFYGTPVPVIRKTAKTFRKDHPNLTRTEWLALIDALWQTSYHEMRSIGIALFDEYPQLLVAEDIERIEALIRRMNTWAHVDWIAAGAAAQLVRQHDTLKQQVLPRWANDDNFWLRRSSLLALMDLAQHHREDFDRFAQLAAAMVEEKEFFIRKAIGWVLREVSKKQPDWTYEFLREHIHQVAGLTLREGAKYLPLEQQDWLMATYQQRTKTADKKTRAKS